MIYNLLHFYAVYAAQNADNARTLKYDLMTNSVRFMQQVTSAMSEGDTIVCN